MQPGTARKPAAVNSAAPQPANLDGILSHQRAPPGPALDHAQRIEPERQQHGLLQPLVDAPAAVDLLGDPEPAGVEPGQRRLDRILDRAAGIDLDPAALLEGVVDHALERCPVHGSVPLGDRPADLGRGKLSEPTRLSTGGRCRAQGALSRSAGFLRYSAMASTRSRPADAAPPVLPAGFLEAVERRVGGRGWSVDPERIGPHAAEPWGTARGRSPLLLRPATTAEVAALLELCHGAGGSGRAPGRQHRPGRRRRAGRVRAPRRPLARSPEPRSARSIR